MARPYIAKVIKDFVKERAKGCCEYCLALSAFAFHPFVMEHITPLIAGGTSEVNNLAFACQHCNNCKHSKTSFLDPLSKEVVRLYHPRNDNWTDHFQWSSDFLILTGKSDIGRATIECLNMNRQEAVNLRGALLAYGVHPPH